MSDIFDHALDAYERAWNGEMDDYPVYREVSVPVPKTCRLCGKAGLHWKKVGDKWRLFEWDKATEIQHICNKKLVTNKLATICNDCSFFKYCRNKDIHLYSGCSDFRKQVNVF